MLDGSWRMKFGSMPCERSATPAAPISPGYFFARAASVSGIRLIVIHAIGLRARVIAVQHQFDFRPNQVQEAVFALFVESLQRPQKVIGGLQANHGVRPGRDNLNGRIADDSPSISKG
jgi:hypothetical protein